MQHLTVHLDLIVRNDQMEYDVSLVLNLLKESKTKGNLSSDQTMFPATEKLGNYPHHSKWKIKRLCLGAKTIFAISWNPAHLAHFQEE